MVNELNNVYLENIEDFKIYNLKEVNYFKLQINFTFPLEYNINIK
jgi:hypothetical protein